MNKNCFAFTLAEVLITLAIIGVVAALTLPSLQAKINDKVYESQRKTAASKLANAVNMLYANEDLAASTDTETFINYLKKQMKVLKVCEKGNLSECFPDIQKSNNDLTLLGMLVPPAYAAPLSSGYPINRQGVSAEDIKLNLLIESWNVTALDQANSNMTQSSGTSNEIHEVELKGLQLVDGTSMLIGYVPDCNIKQSSSVLGVLGYRYDLLQFTASLKSINSSDLLAAVVGPNVTSSSDSTTILPVAKDIRACVGAIIDVNGSKRPNTQDKDVFLYQSTFAGSDGVGGDEELLP